MKRLYFLLILALVAGASRSAWSAEPPKRTARQILDYVDDLFRGVSSQGKLTMKVVTAHYARELTLEEWSKGKQYSLVRNFKSAQRARRCDVEGEQFGVELPAEGKKSD